jgi:hypothetical protein
MRVSGWDENRKGCALIFNAHHFDAAAVQMHKLLHKRQADTGPLVRA